MLSRKKCESRLACQHSFIAVTIWCETERIFQQQLLACIHLLTSGVLKDFTKQQVLVQTSCTSHKRRAGTNSELFTALGAKAVGHFQTWERAHTRPPPDTSRLEQTTYWLEFMLTTY
jgi:hypothetical protein